jgi:predicted phage gp36 major capsid-like protein
MTPEERAARLLAVMVEAFQDATKAAYEDAARIAGDRATFNNADIDGDSMALEIAAAIRARAALSQSEETDDEKWARREEEMAALSQSETPTPAPLVSTDTAILGVNDGYAKGDDK